MISALLILHGMTLSNKMSFLAFLIVIKPIIILSLPPLTAVVLRILLYFVNLVLLLLILVTIFIAMYQRLIIMRLRVS